MRKILFILLMFVSMAANAQKWEIAEIAHNPITNEVINEYVFTASYNNMEYTVKISPVFNNVILISSNTPIGGIKINRFNHSVSAKSHVKYFNIYGEKVSRNNEKVNLGLFNTNLQRKFGSIHSDKVYDYLLNSTGHIEIWCKGLFGGNDISFVIPCVNNK